MYSPRRTTANATENYEVLLGSPERKNLISSPLRTLASPFYSAVKTAQSNASKDFDRFYENLQQRLTPRTSQARIQKKTPDTTNRMKTMLQQRRVHADYDSTRTSLTPLIERHTLREDARANYSEYISRNPFYQESVSEIADTPSLSDRNDDTPMTYVSLGKRSSSFTHSTSPVSNKRTCSRLSDALQQTMAEERKKMDKLHSNLQKIKRQASFLAENLSATHLNFINGKETEEEEKEAFASIHIDNDDDDEEEEDIFIAAAPSSKQDILNSLSAKPVYQRRPSSNSLNLNRRKSIAETADSLRLNKHSTIQQTNNNKPLLSLPATITTPTTFSLSPRRTLNNNTASNTISTASNTISASLTTPNRIISPKRNIINEIGSAKLRSAETISTPGGSRVSNRFWKEIHGLHARRESASPSGSCGSGQIIKRNAPLVKRISTLHNNKPWANDDAFWSADGSPVASSLNNRLFQLAKQNDKEERPTHIRRSFTKKLFDATKEHETANEDSLFQNPLFRKVAAAQSEQPQYMNETAPSPPPPPQPFPTLSSEIAAATKPTIINTSNSNNNNNNSLSAEIESANKRDEIKKRNNIPTMNADVLAELKAKHKEKLIDDSDSYKFA